MPTVIKVYTLNDIKRILSVVHKKHKSKINFCNDAKYFIEVSENRPEPICDEYPLLQVEE